MPNAALILGSALLVAQEMLLQFRHSSHCFTTLGLTYLSAVTCTIMRECSTYGAARHRVAQWICVRQRTSRPVREKPPSPIASRSDTHLCQQTANECVLLSFVRDSPTVCVIPVGQATVALTRALGVHQYFSHQDRQHPGRIWRDTQ